MITKSDNELAQDKKLAAIKEDFDSILIGADAAIELIGKFDAETQWHKGYVAGIRNMRIEIEKVSDKHFPTEYEEGVIE